MRAQSGGVTAHPLDHVKFGWPENLIHGACNPPGISLLPSRTHYDSRRNIIIVNYDDVYRFFFEAQGVTTNSVNNCIKVAKHKIENFIDNIGV